MIKHVYIDNFKCFVNFEIDLKPIQLLMGSNGTGKSAFIEALRKIRQLVVDRQSVGQTFPPGDLTYWQNRNALIFEIHVETQLGLLVYRLEVDYRFEQKEPRILREVLKQDGKNLFLFEEGEVHLFKDTFQTGPEFSADWNYSVLASVPERRENKKLTRFRQWLAELVTFQIDPFMINSLAEKESPVLDARATNFASFYKAALKADPKAAASDLFHSLKESMDGFEQLSLKSFGDDRDDLQVQMKVGGAAHALPFRFNTLSEGQKCLVVLYAVLHCLVREGVTICIDEPDNFLALPEIQPWLLALRDRVVDSGAQVLLISHHPELLNHLAVHDGIRFSRDDGGPVRAKAFSTKAIGNLSAAEIVARGWDNE